MRTSRRPPWHPPRTTRGRRLRLAAAGAAVLTALTVATAGASAPTPMGDAAPMGAGASELTRPGTTTSITSASTHPRTPAPGFLLDRGRSTSFDAPGVALTLARDLNNRGQIAGTTLDDPVTLAGARGFLLAKGVKGPFTPIEVPGAPRNVVEGLNDRGSLVGAYDNTAAQPTPQPAGMQPLGRMA